MEKIIGEQQAFLLIKEGLWLKGYPRNIEIKSYVLDDNVEFYAYYLEEVDGVELKMLTVLSKMDAIRLMKEALEHREVSENFITISLKEERINYEASLSLQNNKTRIRKRKR